MSVVDLAVPLGGDAAVKRTPLKRTTPLRRTRKHGPDIVREEPPRALVPALRPRTDVTMRGSTSGVPVPKGPAAKPGKRTPTADERAWMDAIVAYGCIACRMEGYGFRPAAVHHILRGTVRMGHKFTLPLCDPGHHQNGQQFGMVSRHPWKERFEARYGTEMGLLSTLQGVLKKQPDGSYAP